MARPSAGVSVAACLTAALLAACGTPGATSSGTETALAEAVSASAPMYAALVKMRSAFPTAAGTPCEPTAPQAQVALSWNWLLFVTSADASIPRGNDATDPKGLNDLALDGLQPAGQKPTYYNSEMPAEQRAAFAGFSAATRIVVVRAIETTLPSVVGDSFTPGAVRGIVAGFKADGSLLCASEITAHNSDQVSYMAKTSLSANDSSTNAQRGDFAVHEDLRKQLEQAARAVYRTTP